VSNTAVGVAVKTVQKPELTLPVLPLREKLPLPMLPL